MGVSAHLRAAVALLVLGAASSALGAEPRDVNNPSCPPLSTMQFADWKKMVFTLDTSSGRRVLVADGGIAAGSAAALEKALQDNQPVDEVAFRSPGGSAEEGMKIGFLLRKTGMPTRIPAGYWCASACSFAFLGGPVRTIDPGGNYAVHMFTAVSAEGMRRPVADARDPHGLDELLAQVAGLEQNSALIASEENDYMIRMGASRKLLSEVMYKQKAKDFDGTGLATLRCLTAEEAHQYNVVNVWDGPAPGAKPEGH